MRLVWLLGIAACSSSVSIDDFAARRAEASCRLAVDCGYDVDVESCLATTHVELVTGIGSLRNAVAAGTVRYDGGAAASCFDELFGGACSFSSDAARDRTACDGVFTGTFPTGKPCVLAAECVSEVCTYTACDPRVSCCIGTCADAPAPPTIVELGGDCSAPDTICADGAYCRDDAGVLSCTSRSPEGGTCDTPLACVTGTVCSPGGTCYKPARDGAACDPALDANACDRVDHYCDATSLTCQPRARVGAACPDGVPCVDGATCDTSSCVALPTDGQTCAGGRCAGDFVCNGSNICVPPTGFPVCPIDAPG